MKYILYCRKSSEDNNRQILSLDSQEKEMIKLADYSGIEIVKTFKESKSAKKPDNRPLFAEMIKIIKRGEVDGVLCWKIDRLSRNPIDSATIQWLLQQNTLKIIQTMDRQYLPSDNALLFNVESGMANQYILDLSKNVKRGIRAKLEKGGWANRAPIGYLNDGKGGISVDKARAKYIVRAFELYKTGKYGVKQIAEILFKEGFRSRAGNKYHKSKIHLFLKSSFYAGIMEMDGNKYLGNHQPIISKKLFDDVQEIINQKAHIKKEVIPFAFRGLLKCSSCGCQLTATKKKGKHVYYYCTNGKNICNEHKVYLTEKDVSAELKTIFDKLIIDEKLIELCYLAKKEEGVNDLKYLEEIQTNLNNRFRVIRERKNALLDAYLDKAIDKPAYESKNQELKNEEVMILKELEGAKTKLISNDQNTLERIKNIFLEPKILKKQFLKAKPDKQRNLLFDILWNAQIANKKIVNISFKEPYNALTKLENKDDFNSMRRVRDSNSRCPFGHTSFPGMRTRPLCEPSEKLS